jgi:hypothetical protein
MKRFLIIKIIFYACFLPVHNFSAGAQICSVYGLLYTGELRPIYRGVYMVGGHGEGYFYPTWMAASSTDWNSCFSPFSFLIFATS